MLWHCWALCYAHSYAHGGLLPAHGVYTVFLLDTDFMGQGSKSNCGCPEKGYSLGTLPPSPGLEFCTWCYS